MKEFKRNAYHVYTDGACRGNGKEGGSPGSWALIVYGDTFNHLGSKSGVFPNTTNNEVELTAFANVLEWMLRGKVKCHVYIYTDSNYVQKGYTNWLNTWVKRSWRTANGTPVKNLTLWKRIHKAKTQVDKLRNVTVLKVKGHSGNKGNTAADALCNKVLDEAGY